MKTLYFVTKSLDPKGSGQTRKVDVYTSGDRAIEVKLGRASLTKRIREQVSKDVELLRDPAIQVHDVEWHFTRSPVAGKLGPPRL